MIEAAMNNPAWIAAVVSVLVLPITVATFVSHVRERRARARADDPEFEVTLTPMGGHAGWWRLHLLVRNFWRSRLVLERIAIERPAKARLLPDGRDTADGHEAPFAPGAGVSVLAVDLVLQPVGMERPRFLNEAPARGDYGSVRALVFLPRSASAISMKAICVRKSRSERTMSISIQLAVPAKASSENA